MTLEPIGVISSCYKEKFGIPRQPGLVTEARASLRLNAEFNVDSVRGLEAFSHLWLIFVFHQTQDQGWHPTVRPPRLGGNERKGVFATRSTFRPNPLGLSVVKLQDIVWEQGQVVLHLQGIDLVDGTPIMDIKPYLPYVDAIPQAQGSFAHIAPHQPLSVHFSALASVQCQQQSTQWGVDMGLLIRQILQQDPRPAYRAHSEDERQYGMRLYNFDIRWRYDADRIEVLELAALPITSS